MSIGLTKISKRSFEKIAPCSCDTTEVATAADDNIDFSNTFQRDQAQPINRGSYEKSGDITERVLQITKDIKEGLHEIHVTDSFIDAVEGFLLIIENYKAKKSIHLVHSSNCFLLYTCLVKRWESENKRKYSSATYCCS